MFGLFKKPKLHHTARFPDSKPFVVDYRTKHPLFLYRHMHKKMIECIEAFFEGYTSDKYVFYPPSDEFSDRFCDLRAEFLEIDKSDEFKKLPVTSLRSFQPYSNYKDLSYLWNLLKKDVYSEHQMLIEYTKTFGYELPDDLQILLNKLGTLIKEHNGEKSKILKANHIYPASNSLLLIREKSIRGIIFDLLAQANGEFVSLQTISRKVKEKNFQYLRIVLNQLKKVIEHKKQPLKIESSGKGSYRLTNIN